MDRLYRHKCYHEDLLGPKHKEKATYLEAIYQNLTEKVVPNVDSLTAWHSRDSTSVVYLQPKGRNRLPGSKQEVRDAVGCILEALVVIFPLLLSMLG